MSHRTNSLSRPELSAALGADRLFLDLRDYFGGPEDNPDCHRFECAMEFDPTLGRLEVHFFRAWQEGGDDPLFHLIARCELDGAVRPAVLTIEGKSYNARHLSRERLHQLVQFVGNSRGTCNKADYDARVAEFHDVLKPILLAELKKARGGFTDPNSIFHWGELAILSVA
jgi:hypothetical protein